MVKIRPMGAHDVDAVREVEAAAFAAWRQQFSGDGANPPRRTAGNVLACLGKDPEGCFVAEHDGRVVGIIFSRTWGGVGWFGTFAVLPEFQGQGIGKQLISASLDYLRRDPRRTIGLETMPESPNNLGLYLRMGFQTRLLTLLLERSLDRPASQTSLPRWSAAGSGTQERWLADLREATGQIEPGLDYSKEITTAARLGLGETLVLTEGDTAIGMSLVGLVSTREGPAGERAHVEVLALHPQCTGQQTFGLLLTDSEALAREHGRQALTVAVNARHAWAVGQLLERGYRVRRAMVRMVLQGTDDGPTTDACANLSRWAG